MESPPEERIRTQTQSDKPLYIFSTQCISETTTELKKSESDRLIEKDAIKLLLKYPEQLFLTITPLILEYIQLLNSLGLSNKQKFPSKQLKYDTTTFPYITQQEGEGEARNLEQSETDSFHNVLRKIFSLYDDDTLNMLSRVLKGHFPKLLKIHLILYPNMILTPKQQENLWKTYQKNIRALPGLFLSTNTSKPPNNQTFIMRPSEYTMLLNNGPALDAKIIEYRGKYSDDLNSKDKLKLNKILTNLKSLQTMNRNYDTYLKNNQMIIDDKIKKSIKTNLQNVLGIITNDGTKIEKIITLIEEDKLKEATEDIKKLSPMSTTSGKRYIRRKNHQIGRGQDQISSTNENEESAKILKELDGKDLPELLQDLQRAETLYLDNQNFITKEIPMEFQSLEITRDSPDKIPKFKKWITSQLEIIESIESSLQYYGSWESTSIPPGSSEFFQYKINEWKSLKESIDTQLLELENLLIQYQIDLGISDEDIRIKRSRREIVKNSSAPTGVILQKKQGQTGKRKIRRNRTYKKSKH